MQFQISEGVGGALWRMLSRRPLPDYIPSLENCLSKTQFNRASNPLLNQATSDCPLSAPGDPQTRAAPCPPGSNSSAGAPPSARECGRTAGPARGNGVAAGWSGCGRGMPCQGHGESVLTAMRAEVLRLRSQTSRLRWLPGPGVFEMFTASPCLGWSRRARRCSFRPAPGPEVRRLHRPAAASTSRSRRSGPLVRAASGQVSDSRPRGASPDRLCPSC